MNTTNASTDNHPYYDRERFGRSTSPLSIYAWLILIILTIAFIYFKHRYVYDIPSPPNAGITEQIALRL
jgi:hypothetical protein